MLDQVLKVFDINPQYDLNVMQPNQTLASVTGVMLPAIERVLESCRPDLVFVQGDTTTTLCGALASFYARIPVAHIEAGLRTGDLYQPFPEELNRVIVSKLTTIHFAATRQAADNLDSSREFLRKGSKLPVTPALMPCSMSNVGWRTENSRALARGSFPMAAG
jgi:UDP-N-acetylglucosamine 2-epimerase (non-hydrolysing)